MMIDHFLINFTKNGNNLGEGNYQKILMYT